jgi:hypothetical protein
VYNSAVSTRYATLCATLLYKYGKNQMSNERGWQNSLQSKKIHKSKKYLPLSLQPKSPSKNNAATPSPGRSSPRPRVHSLIVVLLRSATGWCGLIRPPGRKLPPLSYPPCPKIRQKSPSKNEVTTPSPGRSSPRPRVRSLIVVFLRSSTGRCGLIRPPGRKLRPLSYPPPAQKFDKNPLRKTKAPHHPPAVPAPDPAYAC